MFTFTGSNSAVLDAPCDFEDNEFDNDTTEAEFNDEFAASRPPPFREIPTPPSRSGSFAGSAAPTVVVMFSADLRQGIEHRHREADAKRAAIQPPPAKTPREVAEAVVRFAFD